MTIEPRKVYLVDDDPAVRKTLRRGLERRGFSVETFKSAQEFLDCYHPKQPGCLVLDLSMPEMDGLELQQELVNRDIKIPIIFITGHGGVPQSVQALKAGAIDFLEKPFLPDSLTARIEAGLIQDKINRDEKQKIESIRIKFGLLTEREREVAQLMLDNDANLSNKQMAKILGISPRTIEQHRSRVLEKTHAKSAAHLRSLASLIGLTPANTE